LHSQANTLERIKILIPDFSPNHDELRLHFNSLLKLNKTDVNSSAYHPPLDWSSPNLSLKKLAKVHSDVVRNKQLSTYPTSAYLGSLGLVTGESTQTLYTSWASAITHVLLHLSAMPGHEDTIRKLCSYFRLALNKPNKYGWFWDALPEFDGNWERLTSALKEKQELLRLATQGISRSHQEALDLKTLQIPASAYRKVGEVHYAFKAALTNKVKYKRLTNRRNGEVKYAIS